MATLRSKPTKSPAIRGMSVKPGLPPQRTRCDGRGLPGVPPGDPAPGCAWAAGSVPDTGRARAPPPQRLPVRQPQTGVSNVLEFITTLTDEELDAVAAGANVTFTVEATATGLTQADIVSTTKITATTTKAGEAASVTSSTTVTTA